MIIDREYSSEVQEIVMSEYVSKGTSDNEFHNGYFQGNFITQIKIENPVRLKIL